MAYNEILADRVRKILSGHKGLTEKKMFGGISFMLNGHMCCGVLKDDLVIRVGPMYYEKALAEPHIHPMDFTGRPMKGFLFVGTGGYHTDESLSKWVRQAVDFAASLPLK